MSSEGIEAEGRSSVDVAAAKLTPPLAHAAALERGSSAAYGTAASASAYGEYLRRGAARFYAHGAIIFLASSFRDSGRCCRIGLGDISFLFETSATSTVYKIKCFPARIFGQASPMAVAMYEDEEDLKYSRAGGDWSHWVDD
ncbi:hypothetical protein FB451DRAFT_1377425 [Mycena latifolia]|nr:hypothetical protein FB451DRAFT_1377425 [Mycena latifolia]